MVNYSLNSLDQVFSALSDATRRSILSRLAEEGELMVTALAEPYEMSLPAVSKHLRVLKRAGLVVQEKDGRVKRCQLRPEPLHNAADWIDQYRRFWDSKFDALADYLAQIQQESDPSRG